MLYKELQDVPAHKKEDSFIIPFILFLVGIIAMILIIIYAVDTMGLSQKLFLGFSRK